ncbi:MAG: DNA internalization-related competence protein ComEC/Rec2 [Thermodesulfobacteriota bacterium]|nr:DNA internalization-related competence protein ComEC/Rec2 [Thermodesulfobacteriota bacterium]
MNRFWILVHHYLLIALTLAFLSGILLHHVIPHPPQTAIFVTLLLLLPALLYHRRKNTINTTIFLLLAVISLGFLHAANFTASPFKETHIYTRITQEEDVVLTGTLQSMPLVDGHKSSIIIKSSSLRLRHEEFFSPVQGLIKLRLKGSWPKLWLPGEKLIIRARLSRPYRYGNPGGFDYPAFLASKNIRITGRIGSIAHIHMLDRKHSWAHSLRYFPEKIRLSLRDHINNTFPSQQAGIYRALLIGDRSGIDKKELEAFKASGVMHILAISGLHLSLVASTLFLIFYWLARRSQYLMLRFSCKKLALTATIPPLCGYALLAGAQTPVLRSLIMVLVFILAFCVHRQRSPFSTLSFAALLILLLNPLSLFTVSFQLSFAAVASLILILPNLTSLLQQKNEPDKNSLLNLLSRSSRWVTAALLVSIAATIGTAPLLIHSFNRLSTVGPVANLLLEPLLCLWSLPWGLLSIPVLFIDPQYGGWLLQTGGLGIKTAMSVTNFFADFRGSTLWFATPPPLLILFYYFSLVLCFSKLSWTRTLPLFLFVCSLFFFPPQSFLEKYSTESELVFLDVGQGSSTLINFPGGKTVLVDGGGSSSAKFNVGESLIAPYLWHRGITHLDTIIVTHPDADHFNGIPFLLQRFQPDILWTNGESGHSQQYDDMLELARNLRIKTKIPEGNELIMEAGGAILQNINNPFLDKTQIYNAVPLLHSNDKSLILHFAGRDLSCLLPGDITQRVEKALVSNNSLLQSSILLSPHHGSKTSNSPVFIDAVNPEQIIVSAGRFHPFLFPSSGLRSYCEENNIPLLNTAKIGAVTIRETRDGVELSHLSNQGLLITPQ